MEDKLTIKKIIEVYESIQGTGNTNYQNRFYFKQLRKIKKVYERLGN
jgi:hypothetical protein